MSLMLRRYAAATGYARSWLYVVFSAGFLALAVWGFVREDWLAMGIAAAMAIAALTLVPITQRLSSALRTSTKEARE
jgi:uncharacterized membrane protein YjjP (DUF1212 family)